MILALKGDFLLSSTRPPPAPPPPPRENSLFKEVVTCSKMRSSLLLLRSLCYSILLVVASAAASSFPSSRHGGKTAASDTTNNNEDNNWISKVLERSSKYQDAYVSASPLSVPIPTIYGTFSVPPLLPPSCPPPINSTLSPFSGLILPFSSKHVGLI